MSSQHDGMAAQGEFLLLKQEEIAAFDRGEGVRTLPFVGKWNCRDNRVTTGMTFIDAGTGIPLHSHNVEETVLVVAGTAQVTVADRSFAVSAGEATWVPADVPHRFVNHGDGILSIYWVYGGRDVTRTITDTGQTFEHLSPDDRGVVQVDD